MAFLNATKPLGLQFDKLLMLLSLLTFLLEKSCATQYKSHNIILFKLVDHDTKFGNGHLSVYFAPTSILFFSLFLNVMVCSVLTTKSHSLQGNADGLSPRYCT